MIGQFPMAQRVVESFADPVRLLTLASSYLLRHVWLSGPLKWVANVPFADGFESALKC